MSGRRAETVFPRWGAMATLAAMVRSLSAKLDELEAGAACPGDWVRLQVAVMRAAILARQELAGMCPNVEQRETVDELVDELRYIKLCAEAHLVIG